MYICFCFSAWTCLHLCKILLVVEAVWLLSWAITSVLWYSLQLGHISNAVREFFSWQCLEDNFLAVYSGFFGWKAADCSDLSYHRQPLHYLLWFSSVQFSLSRVWLFASPWTAACQASLSITNSQSLHRLMSIDLVMPSNHLIFCRPLLLLPSIFPSIRIFSNESVFRIRWPEY